MLAAATGRRIRAYPAAPFGGAVAADAAATVIVGAHAVTRYANRSGAVMWSRPTGQVAQAWQEEGNSLYITVAAGGYLGSAPVTALRRINLRTGAERLIRPRGHAFTGSLSLAFDGAVFFARRPGDQRLQRDHRRPAVAPAGRVAGKHRRDAAAPVSAGRQRAGRGGPTDREPGWPGSPVPPPPNPPGCTGCGRARSSASTTVRSAGPGATTSLPSGCRGPAPRCRGRTTSWTCRGSGGVPRPGGDGLLLAVCAATRPATGSPARRSRVCGRS